MVAPVVSNTRVSRASVGLRSARGPILLGVMLSVGLVAIDATILATAVPSVVGDLGGFTQFPWLFSVYLLAQAVSVPLFAKLSDLYGRKPVMLAGIALFVLGSLLCGVAWGMTPLIVFRAVQGLGAGAIMPVSMTMVGDLYSMEERATVQGYLASVWAAASLIGPALGGVFADYLSWRGIFLVNLPLGLVAGWILYRRFEEHVTRARHHIDVLGSALLTGGGVLLLLGLLEGGQRWAWGSATSIALFVVAAVLLAVFVAVERRVAEPVLPLWVFRLRVVNATAAASLLVGVVTLGLSSYVPLFAQGVLGTGALTAGFALAAMTLGWPLAASVAGRIYLTAGFRTTMLLGAGLALAGSLLLLTVGPGTSVLFLGGACFVVGLGLGFVASPAVVGAQSSVGWQSRGVVTGTNMFARSVGSSVGVAVFGALANGVVARRLGGRTPDLQHLDAAVLDPAVHAVFLASAVVAAVMIVAAVFMPGRIVESARSDAPQAAVETA